GRVLGLVAWVVASAAILVLVVRLVVNDLYAHVDPRLRLTKSVPMVSTTALTIPPPVEAPRGLPRWLRLVRAWPLLPMLILMPLILVALGADVIAPYDPIQPVPGAKIYAPPFWMPGGSMHALLGTDFQGRDILSRLLFGARVSLIVGVMGTLVAGSLGAALGILAGYMGGLVEQVIMRVTDAWLALPALVF